MRKQIAIHSQYKMTQLICSVKYVFQACELWFAEKISGRKTQVLLYFLALLACNANKVITMQTFFIILSLPRGAVLLEMMYKSLETESYIGKKCLNNSIHNIGLCFSENTDTEFLFFVCVYLLHFCIYILDISNVF